MRPVTWCTNDRRVSNTSCEAKFVPDYGYSQTFAHWPFSAFCSTFLYANWGEAYALYVTAFALVGFAQIVGEPLQLIYYGLQQDGFRRIFALLIVVLASIYMVVLAPAILVYGIFIDTSLQALICFILLPLFSATQQLGKACLIHQNKIIVTSLLESVGLLVKFPLGYMLIKSGHLPFVTDYLLYFCGVSACEVLFSGWVVQSSHKGMFFVHSPPSVNQLFGQLRTFGQLSLLTFIVTVLGSIDRLWIAKIEHPENLIKYSFALSVAALFHIVPGQISLVYQPVYFKPRSGPEQISLLFKQVRDIAISSCLLFAVFLSLKKHLAIWLGDVLSEIELELVKSLAIILASGVVLNMLFIHNKYLSSGLSSSLLLRFRHRLSDIFYRVNHATHANSLLSFAYVTVINFNGYFVFRFHISLHERLRLIWQRLE